MTGDFSRRFVLAGIGAATIVDERPVDAQTLTPVRLLVLRKPAAIPSTNCVSPCIRGSVFDISDISGPVVPAAVLASGRLPICDVVERPWANNLPSVSAIPKGTYAASVRTDRTKPWMQATPSRAWRLELAGVPGGRSAIQFHYGLDAGWSQGCFVVGKRLAAGAAFCTLANADGALAAIRSAVLAPGRDATRISVVVADANDLFQGAATGC